MLNPFPLGVALEAAAGGRPVRRPVWRLAIEGQDVTREISPVVESVTYTDHAHGESDAMEIVIGDPDGKWRGPWRPAKGDVLLLSIGYEGEASVDCGRFEVDEMEASGPPDVLTVRALAAGPVPSLRTKRDQGYEKQGLRKVVQTIAARHGLRVVGEVNDSPFDRLTQKGEDDLEFLTRLAEEHGYAFSVRGGILSFVSLEELEAQAPVFTLSRRDCTEYRLGTTTRTLYRAVEVTYDRPRSKETLRRLVEDPTIRTGDVHKMRVRVTTAAQAEARGRAALRRLNGKENVGSLTLAGEPGIVAGVNGTLAEFGAFDGKYAVDASYHRISRTEGYTMECQVRRVMN